MDIDTKGNPFLKVGNLRITYLAPGAWQGHASALRVQAYKVGEVNAVHQGPEIPVAGLCDALRISIAIVRAYVCGKMKKRVGVS